MSAVTMQALVMGGAGGGGGGGDPNFANVVLLCHFNGTNGSTTFTDSSGTPATLTARGNAQLSTTNPKFGTACLLLDGTGDDCNTNRACGIGTGQFTIEAWVRPSSAQTGRVVSSQNSVSTNPVVTLRVESTGALRVLLRSASGSDLLNLASSTGLVAMNDTVTYHVAVTRDGSNNVNIWLDGTSVANSTSTASPGFEPYVIGSQFNSAEFFAGRIDDVRITEGVCRYTSTFTPPAAQFPDS